MLTLSNLTTDQLAEGICLRAGRIAAAEAELLQWIAEFDEREGWAGPGLLSCAHWLNWRIGLSPGAARERVRVARSLRDLPLIAAAFADGRVSWSKVRAITRVARPYDGIEWVELARSTSGAQMEKLVRGLRRVHRIEEADRDPERADWLLRTRKTYDDDGNLVMTIYAKAEVAPVIEAALETKRAELEREHATADADIPGGTGGARTADGDVPAGTPEGKSGRVTDGEALLAIAQDSLAAGDANPALARRNRYRLTAEIDPLSGWARLRDGELLPPTSLQGILRSLPGRGRPPQLRPVTPADLRRHDLARTSRVVSANLRELLGRIDGERCRFPGCTRHRKLHAHHVVYWSDGGGTDLENLILICSRHHTLVHHQGFRLVLHADRRLEVRTAEGAAVLHHPAQPWGDPAALASGCGERVSAGTLPPEHCEARMDLGYVVSVLLAQAS